MGDVADRLRLAVANELGADKRAKAIGSDERRTSEAAAIGSGDATPKNTFSLVLSRRASATAICSAVARAESAAAVKPQPPRSIMGEGE